MFYGIVIALDGYAVTGGHPAPKGRRERRAAAGRHFLRLVDLCDGLYSLSLNARHHRGYGMAEKPRCRAVRCCEALAKSMPAQHREGAAGRQDGRGMPRARSPQGAAGGRQGPRSSAGAAAARIAPFNRGARPAPHMATVQQEFDISAALRELYKDLPYVTKLGYSGGELGERILVRVIIEGDRNDDEFYDYSMAAVRKAREFRDMMPASMRDRYEVVPIVTEPYEGGLSHFDTITTVIDRRAEAGAPDAL